MNKNWNTTKISIINLDELKAQRDGVNYNLEEGSATPSDTSFELSDQFTDEESDINIPHSTPKRIDKDCLSGTKIRERTMNGNYGLLLAPKLDIFARNGNPLKVCLIGGSRIDTDTLTACGAKLVKQTDDYDLILASRDTNQDRIKDDIFSVDYIHMCVRKKKLVDVIPFRLNRISKFYNPEIFESIVLGIADRSSLQPKDSPVLQPVFSDTMSISSYSKRSRLPYRYNEQKKIVEYIIRNKLYNEVKGTLIWKEMEQEENLLSNRTWQSMKENFLKKIYPNINAFGLSQSEISNFRRGFAKSYY
ncbi:uncharacterized protein LOC136038706 [Artemia franciscana]|uniref:uncharacterized protein LOC136038706 n=1 Tax=Artemia franciscana TaxID=6661 RepID=UPI0032DA1279